MAEQIVCEQGKLLARRDERGLFLYCKLCHTEHFYTWEALQGTVSEQAKERSQDGLQSGIVV